MGVIRKTKSVETVLSLIQSMEGAMSVMDLVSRLEQDMNKSTVYRILERLQDDGLVHSFIGGDGLLWFARCNSCEARHHNDDHPHFQCRRCGKTQCLSVELALPSVSEVQIDSMQVLFFGECQDCMN